ncbi:hypothetical protein HL42_4753 [Trichophyton rubrum]|nr:hypothetical protein HL42_4753 [Trichophyton rubrum]
MIYVWRAQDAKPSSPPWAVLPPPAALVAPRELLTKAAESRHLATEQTKKTRRSGTNNADRKTGADEMALWYTPPTNTLRQAIQVRACPRVPSHIRTSLEPVKVKKQASDNKGAN